MLFAGLPASFDAKWSRRGVGLVLAFVLAATGLVVASAQGATAQSADQSAAERCSEFHLFGAEPVDVAKTADGETVLAQASWGYHESIGCFLSLDDDAVASLRAAGPPSSLPQGQTDASNRCFEHHRFGAEPVDVAKTADRQTVLARLSWGFDSSIGCYLALDSAAINTLRDAAAPPSAFTAIAAGELHSCALTDQGRAVCWGDNSLGQADAPQGTFTAIAAGSDHSCAITDQGQAVCWGDNSWGKADAPQGTFTAIAAGGGHSCAIDDQGRAVCWGLLDAPPQETFTAITAGAGHSCALTTEGRIACWGRSSFGRTDAPQGTFTAVATGWYHSCALNDLGWAVCWGSNMSGRTDAPQGTFTAIAAGGGNSCALTTEGRIACWGDNSWGKADAPQGTFTAIAAGWGHSCAIDDQGQAVCWGDNDDGQASPPTLEDLVSSPTSSSSETDTGEEAEGHFAAYPGPRLAIKESVIITAGRCRYKQVIDDPQSSEGGVSVFGSWDNVGGVCPAFANVDTYLQAWWCDSDATCRWVRVAGASGDVRAGTARGEQISAVRTCTTSPTVSWRGFVDVDLIAWSDPSGSTFSRIVDLPCTPT